MPKKTRDVNQWKQCAHCKKTFDKKDNHYSDIPGIGDLCNPCHEVWSIDRNK